MSAYAWTFTVVAVLLIGAVVWVVVGAVRERRDRQTQEDAPRIAKLKAAGHRKWPGEQR